VRLSFRAKLIAIVGTAAAALVVLIIASAVISSRTERELAKIERDQLPKLQLGPRLQADFERLERAYQDSVAAHDADAVGATREIEAKLFADLDGARGAVTPGQAAVLRVAVDDYSSSALDVARRLIAGETGERLVDAMSAMQMKQARAGQILGAETAFNPQDLAANFAAARQAEVSGGHIRLAISLICLVGLILLSWKLGGGVVRALSDVVLGLGRFGEGAFDRSIPIPSSDDELADLARQANHMAERLRVLAQERDSNDWIREAVAGLAQETRGELEPPELAARAVRFLARHLGAPVAALYYAGEGGDLGLLGQYGRDGDQAVATRFRQGEGLVGQAALSDEVTVVSDVPANYLRVRSGLGEGAPRAIVLLPLRQGGRSRGVLELALFTPWTAREADALTQVRENLVIAIEVALARVATRRLLAETQRQADRLTQQEEELRATNEELETQQEELRESNAELTEQAVELEAQQRTLQQSNAELEEARARLEQKATELSTVSSYKSQFLANMSHELRTPLNSMLLLSNLLAENDDQNLSDRQVQFARTIHTAGKDLLTLINQVLDLAKIESGKREVKIAPLPVRELAGHAQMIFAPLAADKQLRLTVDVAPEVPEIFHSDGQQLEQILRNLLGNAVKFTAQGEVALRIYRAPPGTRLRRLDLPRDGALVFEVSDTGLGIAPEDQDRIFAPFEQVDAAIDRRYGGTGLGLSISRELAALLGGELQVESALGKGSTFRLFLPIAPAPAVAAAELAEPKPPAAAPAARTAGQGGGGDLLLVIEDDRPFAEAFAEVARRQGFECVIASDGKTGLRLARELRPLGIVLDVRLPDTDGWRVMEELQYDPQTAQIAVHFISAVNAAERGLALGAVGYLTKPATRSDIVRVIGSLTTKTPEGADRVLVVEDEVATSNSLAKQLADEKLEVRCALTAAQALEMLDRERFGCMVLDLSLPDMDGLELLENLRARPGVAVPSIVVYTARALTKAEISALEAHVQAVVVKDGSSTERLIDEVRLFTRRLWDGAGGRRGRSSRLAPGSLNLSGRKILVVDDDMRTVYALSATLRAKGAEVLVADNGKMALDLLDRRPDVQAVLMDIMMPEMDGFEAMRRIRRDARFGSLPVIALTAKAIKGDHEKCLEAGASDYLPKPIDADRLLVMLNGFLSAAHDNG
jgi:CheY-like chemotaxis protein